MVWTKQKKSYKNGFEHAKNPNTHIPDHQQIKEYLIGFNNNKKKSYLKECAYLI